MNKNFSERIKKCFNDEDNTDQLLENRDDYKSELDLVNFTDLDKVNTSKVSKLKSCLDDSFNRVFRVRGDSFDQLKNQYEGIENYLVSLLNDKNGEFYKSIKNFFNDKKDNSRLNTLLDSNSTRNMKSTLVNFRNSDNLDATIKWLFDSYKSILNEFHIKLNRLHETISGVDTRSGSEFYHVFDKDLSFLIDKYLDSGLRTKLSNHRGLLIITLYRISFSYRAFNGLRSIELVIPVVYFIDTSKNSNKKINIITPEQKDRKYIYSFWCPGATGNAAYIKDDNIYLGTDYKTAYKNADSRSI